ncbi:MAG: hypothetical protein ACKVU4_08295 [Phycisphaerales bacterium]
MRVNTGLNTILSDRPPPATVAKAPPKAIPPDPFEKSDLGDMLRRQAIDTQRILDDLNKPAPPADQATTVGASAPLGTNRPAPRVEVEAAAVEASVLPPAPVPPPAPAEPMVTNAAPIEKPLAERLDAASIVLLDLLRDKAARTPDMATLLALAAMEAVRPGSTPGLPLPPDATGSALTPVQAAVVEAYREASEALARAAAKDGEGVEGSDLADVLGGVAAKVAGGQPLRIRDAQLCSRVRGFGQFTAFGDGGTSRFMAGRAQRVIVYVEIDRFAHREVSAGDAAALSEPGGRWAVEISQEINLYSDAGNLLVLRRPPERVLESARVKRRDFYLVTEVTLPGTLAAGRYNFKVTVRDATSGAVAERVIPVEVVADAALTRGGR